MPSVIDVEDDSDINFEAVGGLGWPFVGSLLWEA